MHSDVLRSNYEVNSNEAPIRKKWLHSFFLYYGYSLPLFVGQLFFDAVSWNQFLLWVLCAGFYFLSYKRFDVYLLLLLTGAAPLIFFIRCLNELVDLCVDPQLAFALPIVIIQLGLLFYFVYNCYQLLGLNRKRNQLFY